MACSSGGSRASVPALIHYWHSEEIPSEIADCLATFPAHNPDLQQIVFNERSAREFIAERYGTRHVQAFAACAIPAMQADYLRYCAIHALGGVYADADFVSVAAQRSLLDGVDGHLFQNKAGTVFNDLFGFRSPGHPLLAMAIEIATANIEGQISNCIAFTTGPGIFTGLLWLYRTGSFDGMHEAVAPVWRSSLGSCWDSFLNSFDRAIEAHGPVAQIFDRVRVSPLRKRLAWVRTPDADLQYKGANDYWMSWKGSIFRSAAKPAHGPSSAR